MKEVLTRHEIADIVLTTCLGCENANCPLTQIWPELKRPLEKEEKAKFERHLRQRLNIKAGKQQVEKAILACSDCNPYDHDSTIGRCAP